MIRNETNTPRTLQVLDLVSQWVLTIVFLLLGFEALWNLQGVIEYIKALR